MSGVGFPIPYPVRGQKTQLLPEHIPTLVEDDVFLMEHSYCYTFGENGDNAPIPTVLHYLHKWIFEERVPVVLNLHPEHVHHENRMLFTSVLAWASQSSIWMPSLYDFDAWLRERDNCSVRVSLETDEQTITICGPSDLCWIEAGHALN